MDKSQNNLHGPHLPLPTENAAGANHDNLIFSEETMQSLRDLGAIFERIHNRLIAEGHTIEDGHISEKPVE